MTVGDTPAQPNVEAGHRNRPVVVSAVLPTYNGSRYLAESIQSVIDQTFQDWELIIVDDCSTDETPQIIARFVQQDPRICCIRHETNRKLPAALNTGFAAARGEFFTWTSDDNLFRPLALGEMVAALGQDSTLDVVYCDYAFSDSNGRITGARQVGLPRALVYGNVVGACFLYRRNVHETLGGYDESLFLAEDYDFWLRCAASFAMRPLHKDLYVYRWHDQSLTERRHAEISRASYVALNTSLARLPGLGRYLRAQGHLQLARWAVASGEAGAARRHLLCAFWRAPRSTWRNERKLIFGLCGGRNPGRLSDMERSSDG